MMILDSGLFFGHPVDTAAVLKSNWRYTLLQYCNIIYLILMLLNRNANNLVIRMVRVPHISSLFVNSKCTSNIVFQFNAQSIV